MSTNNYDWKKLYFGKVTKEEVQQYCVHDREWQDLRRALKNTSSGLKYHKLLAWLKEHDYSRAAQVQVTNYITALSRGGIIKPGDYRC